MQSTGHARRPSTGRDLMAQDSPRVPGQHLGVHHLGWLTVQIGGDALHRVPEEDLVGLPAHVPDMRSQYSVVEPLEWMVSGQGLLIEHIEACARDRAGLERMYEGPFVDDRPRDVLMR